MHEGVRYPCDKCEHTATAASDLKKHIEIKHDGVRYPCHECEFVFNLSTEFKNTY